VLATQATTFVKNITLLRHALSQNLGEILTPELAAWLEGSAFAVTSAPAMLPKFPTREQIEHLENLILQGVQEELPTKHHFSPGMYSREMFIKAGTVLTGAVHKTHHLSVFVGDITVWTEDGMKRITGHQILQSKPGAKRVGFAHADTWCTGFFPTDKTTIEEVEAELCEDPQLLLCNRPDIGLIPVLEK